MSLLNFGAGLSSAANAASSFLGPAALAQQKAGLEMQTAVLANQLKEGTDVKMAGINQTNALARIPVQGQQDIATAEATQAAKGKADIGTATAENQLPMTATQIAANKVAQQDANSKTTEANRPFAPSFGGTMALVPDKTSPDGYRRISLAPSGSDAAPDPTSNNLSKQIGLSENGIHSVTGELSGRAAIPYTSEAQAWAAKNNINIDTLKASAKAINQTLTATSERSQLGAIQEREIQGSIDTITPILDDMNAGKINKANVLKIWAGGQVNDPDAMKAVDQITRLKEELAGYNAIANAKITNGHPNPEKNELDAANAVITNGLNGGSLKAFGQSIAASSQKNRDILQKSQDDASTQLYSLFGAKYQAPVHPGDQAGGGAAPAAGSAPATASAQKTVTPGTLLGKTPDGRDVIAGPDGKPHVRDQ